MRDTTAAGVPQKSEEETPPGADVLLTTCDRSKRPDVDWSSRSGEEILQNICDASGPGSGPGRREPQETIAPDDPAAPEASLP